MGCGGCNQRRVDLGAAIQAASAGDLQAAAAKLGNVATTFGQDAAAITRAAGQKLAAAHARLKR